MHKTRRRRIAIASAAALLGSRISWAQQSTRIYRIGRLALIPKETFLEHYQEFVLGMRDLGYIEGKNLVIEFRSADYKPERLVPLAEELVRSKVEVIVTGANSITRAANQATQRIPIVMQLGVDVVEEGFVASLAKPGRNITGLTWEAGREFQAKRVEFLKEAIPRLSRAALLDHSADRNKMNSEWKQSIADACAANRISLIELPLTDDFDKLFQTALGERAEGMITLGGVWLFAQRKRFVDIAKRYRLPVAYDASDFVELGGLMSYSTNASALHRRSATYVDKILKGARPGELPVERPTRFDLTINLRNANELGINIAPSLLARASKVIQ